MKLLICLGTRPEIMKNYSTVKAARAAGDQVFVYWTSQHFDAAMSTVFFEEMGYEPDEMLDGGYKIGKCIDDLMKYIRKVKPDVVLANGDTSAALIAAVAAMYTDTKFAHVEAGLRSYDPEMLEERNRIMVDAVANYLFPYTNYQAEFLKSRQELRGSVYVAGNTTIDLLQDFSDRIERPSWAAVGYVYMTLHRKELTDRYELFLDVIKQIDAFSIKNNKTIIWPVHPRSKDVLDRHNFNFDQLNKLFKIEEPCTAFESLSYEKYADLMITDSGCIQEEVCVFGVPCVTVRQNTERPETIEIGANVLSGFKNIGLCAEHMLKYSTKDWKQPYGIYGVGERIVATLRESL